MEESIEVDGEVYGLNDHVYLSAPWNTSDGAPWLIGRIMEFIREPSQSTSTQTSTANNSTNKKRRKSSLKLPPIVQVKLGHFHRQRDIVTRHIIDCRLLAASMTYDVFSISRLRGKCRVDYRPLGEDLEELKNTPDCFYFHQVYGRYTHRHYDVIPTENVKNAPPEVVQYLRSNYSYIFAESGMGPQLGDERRGCVTCQNWATGADSVTCALCSRAYHFACLNPPLTRKPERGYTWACAPCSKQRQDEIEDSLSKGLDATPASASGSGRTLRDKGKKKETPTTTVIQSGSEAGGTLRTVDGWPFRYYGQYTDPATVLDEFDLPFLYTPPRLGPRFQTNVPDDPSEEFVPFAIPANRVGRPCKIEKRFRDGSLPYAQTLAPEVEQTRGGDETIDVISTVEQFQEENGTDLSMASGEIQTLEQYLAQVTSLPAYKHVGVSLLDRALIYHRESATYEEALEKVKTLSIKSLGFASWTETESHRMDSAIQDLGEDLRAMLKHFPKKTTFNIAQFYYMCKGQKFPEASAYDSRVAASGSEFPDENALTLPPPSTKRPYICVVCETRVSKTWRRCPDALMAGAALAKKCICDECHFRWRRYGLHHAPSLQQDDAKPRDRRTKVPNKPPKPPTVKSVTAETSPVNSVPMASPSSPPHSSVLPSPPPVCVRVVTKACVLCQKAEPTAQLAQCQSCTLTCHRECGGLENDTDLSQWLCLLCKTAGSKTLPKIPSCSLCIGHQPLISQDDPLSALDIWKLTEYNSFVHLLCAIWHHELVFSETSTYEKVEGFASIPSSKRTRDCEICRKHNIGACVKCDGCNKQVHVSCAWAAGYKLRFEMQPPKRKRNRELDFIRFKDEEGCLEPKIWCSAHSPGHDKPTYELGERDEVTNLTALQVYAGKFKTTAQAPSCGTLRKARRLDTVLTSVLLPKVPTESLGKGLDLEDEYMVAALGVLQKSAPASATVIEPTPAAPPRQRKPIENAAPEPAPRVRIRAKPRVRSRAKSRTKVRVRGASRTDNTLVEPSQEFANDVGENKDEDDDDDDTDMQQAINHDNSVAGTPHDLDIKSGPVDVIERLSPVSVTRSAPRSFNHIVVPAASPSQSESMKLKDNANGQRGSSRPVKTSSAELSLASSSKGPSQQDLTMLNPPAYPADIRGTQTTSIKKPTHDHSSVPPTAPATPAIPKPVNKLRLTIKPAASPPAPSKSPITEPEPARHKAPPVSSSTFPFVPTSNVPAFMSHPPRPMSSASSSSSASLKPPQVTRLPSINQLDSFLPSLPRLHHLAPLPTPSPMFMPTTSQSSVIHPRGASPTTHGPMTYQHSSPSTLPHLAFNPTPVPSMRVSAPLLNPPSFDAFAAAAAAHTTTKSTGSSTSARTGTSVSPASSHKNIELNPPLLHNPVHFS